MDYALANKMVFYLSSSKCVHTAHSSTGSREMNSKKCISHSGAERIFVLSIINWYRIAQNERMPGSRNTHRAACIIHSLHFS